MLAEKIEKEAGAEVLFNHRMLNYVETKEGIEVFLETPYDICKIHAKYLIGADGANSIVRKLMGVEFDGFTYPEKFLCLTTKEPLEDHLPNLALVNYVSDPEEWTVLLRVPSLWRVLVPASGNDSDDYLKSDEKKEKVFAGLIDKPDVETEHRTIYSVHQRVAKSFRSGRAMIVGDAAHLNNPLGGFGMNSGIHDAFNLCPKLVEIIKGSGDKEALLTQFNDERQRQTHEFVQKQTLQNMAFMTEGESGVHNLRKNAMRKLLSDNTARREYLLRQSMIESVREAAREIVKAA